MKSRRAHFWVVFAILAGITFLASAATVLAQTPLPRQVSDDQVNAVARELFCPVCENIPLDVCQTPACAQWRELIRQKLSVGWGKDQIKEYFRLQYGDRVLGAPPPEGLHWLVYILPPLSFLVGVYLVVRAMRNRKPAAARPAAAGVDNTAADDPYLKRFEEELKKRSE